MNTLEKFSAIFIIPKGILNILKFNIFIFEIKIVMISIVINFIKFNKLVFFLMLKINISNIFSKIIISKSVIGILEIYE